MRPSWFRHMCAPEWPGPGIGGAAWQGDCEGNEKGSWLPCPSSAILWDLWYFMKVGFSFTLWSIVKHREAPLRRSRYLEVVSTKIQGLQVAGLGGPATLAKSPACSAPLSACKLHCQKCARLCHRWAWTDIGYMATQNKIDAMSIQILISHVRSGLKTTWHNQQDTTSMPC